MLLAALYTAVRATAHIVDVGVGAFVGVGARARSAGVLMSKVGLSGNESLSHERVDGLLKRVGEGGGTMRFTMRVTLTFTGLH